VDAPVERTEAVRNGLGVYDSTTEGLDIRDRPTPRCSSSSWWQSSYIVRVRFEKVWTEQCRATRVIKRRFGVRSALDYLIGEKLVSFADAAEQHPEFSQELPRFLAATWRTFNEFEIAGYVASQRPARRVRLRRLLFLK